MTEAQRAKRNLSPTAPALVAMIIWGDEYARQDGGSMAFWDSLDKGRRRRCEMVVEALAKRGAGK